MSSNSLNFFFRASMLTLDIGFLTQKLQDDLIKWIPALVLDQRYACTLLSVTCGFPISPPTSNSSSTNISPKSTGSRDPTIKSSDSSP
eukprot:snap_masked-scaffold_21-processed-gene-5.72-mRNA-1 protein AED:1.00 eAED:1.00 QI:0/0/0/0/1/1/3/0/87